MIQLDLSGLKCPLPALKTRKALRAMQRDRQLEVICTDPLASIDIPNLVRECGDILEECRQEGRKLVFTIRRASGKAGR